MSIELITAEEEARMPEWVDKYTKIGLSTEEADFEKAEWAIKNCYRIVDEDESGLIIMRFDSPLAATLGGIYGYSLLEMGQKYDEDKIRERVALKMSGKELPDDAWTKQIAGNRQYWSHYRGGQLWAGWVAYMTFLRDVLGYQDETLADFAYEEALVNSAGWVWLGEGICTLSNRMAEIHNDDQDRLHNDNGPAVAWRDNWSIHCLGGVTVEPEMLAMSPEQIMKVINAEQRMALIRRIGIDKMQDQLDHKVIDVLPWTPESRAKYYEIPDHMKNEYELLRIKMENGEYDFLKMLNPSTAQIHIEGVTSCGSVHDAYAFRVGDTQYDPPVFIA